MSTKMTPAALKERVSTGKDSHFFERSSMKFFGDTMANYGVRAGLVTVTTSSGVTHQCYELYRKQPVKQGLKSSAFFGSTD